MSLLKNNVSIAELSEIETIERYKFTVAYDGTQYLGFQIQGNTKTVQKEIESALRTLDWNEKNIAAAGRTDSGVHAEGQVFSAALNWKHSPEKLRDALNARLPKDISVLEIEKKPLDFNARYNAVSRTYHYHIYQEPARNPLRDRYAWCFWPKLKIEILSKAAAQLIGKHDFRSFGSPPRKLGTTIRTVSESRWLWKSEDEIIFEITANAFLYHMVRRIVFLQTFLSQGVISMGDWENAVMHGSGAKPGMAPPNGLRLFAVNYQEQQ